MASNLKNELKDQIDGQSNEYKEIIIQNETKKFMEIFNKVFSGNENENENADMDDNMDKMDDIDDIDGIVEDILDTIVSRVKTILKQNFIKKLLKEEEEEEEEEQKEEQEEDGENKISSKKET